ncbi:MAG: recombinase family protein, partial [Rhizobiaceae bacterium]|nr:recombinase family protein [Rhizobiaceae bacterium]
EVEAATVQRLFDRYLDLGSVIAVAQGAQAEGWSTRTLRRRDGSEAVTRPFGRGNLYHLLSNPIHIGMIRHRDQLHEGEHDAIITQDTFDQAQTLLAAQAPQRKSSTNAEGTHLLTGLLYDADGNRMHPVHASKGQRRYRYYVSVPRSKEHSEANSDRPHQWRLSA